MMKRKRLKMLVFGMASAFCVSAAGMMNCSAEEETWAIYWYLCGSDLESQDGSATEDLAELMEVELPENVSVIIETGGTTEWQNEIMDSEYLERYYYDSEDLYLLEQLEPANMGDSKTLADFLTFCQETMPADHEIVLFWDHGGGSIDGACADERYDYDSLKLKEFREAFEMAGLGSEEDPPFDLVGFDCCLMATLDTAEVFTGIADYLVASEETEPGCGWDYTAWVGALAENTGMNAAEVGEVICDSYLKNCEEQNIANECTLSVIDLSKIPELIEAYESAGREAITLQTEDPSFFTRFSRGAKSAVSFGGNTASAGYRNLVDLGSLMEKNRENLPEKSDAVREALEDCVTYMVNGKYCSDATGLSCYYSLNNDREELADYAELCKNSSFSQLYTYCLSGEVSESMAALLEEEELDEADLNGALEISFADTEPQVTINEDGYAVLDLGAELAEALESVTFELYYVNEEEDYELYLGNDNNLYMDWETGVFSDNFSGIWGTIDGYWAYMELAYEGEDYNLYLVPILLNGEEYELHVVYDYDFEEYEILGAAKGIEENGLDNRELVELTEGDVITTLFYEASYSGEDELELMEGDEFEVTEDTCFYDADLGDGLFIFCFCMTDALGNTEYSDPVYFTVEDGEIYVE